VRQNFVDAAKLARDVGFEWLELHFAHGYVTAAGLLNAMSDAMLDRYKKVHKLVRAIEKK
jgi:2,4-dienoyl-CoA reductase-like NADH-dependent reductase (Old Yellow Enzyme family)